MVVSNQYPVAFLLFQACFCDFAFVFNMLALSTVLIFSIVNSFNSIVVEKKCYVLLYVNSVVTDGLNVLFILCLCCFLSFLVLQQQNAE